MKPIHLQKNRMCKPIFIKTMKSLRKILPEDILYIECEVSVCWLFLTDGTNLVCTKPLNYFEALLSDCGFVTISRSLLVNIRHIREIFTAGPKKVICELVNGVRLPVSYRKWRALKARLLQE